MPVKRPRATAPPSKPDRKLRPAQRRRTRKAIVDAAIALLSQGVTPSVDDVAAAADVSRRTIYLYFETFDQLLLDATARPLSIARSRRTRPETPSRNVSNAWFGRSTMSRQRSSDSDAP
jgi:AcrR family transcriptional regulator